MSNRSGFLLPLFPGRARPRRPERAAPFHAEEELAEGEDADLGIGPLLGLSIGGEGEEHHAADAVSEEHREPEPGEEVEQAGPGWQPAYFARR